MAIPDENRRTDSIRVRLSPEMMARFEALAKRYGMPPATLCAFAVAQFTQNEENKLSMARMAVMDASRRAGEKFEMDEETMERLFGPMLAEIAMQAALTQQNLPLDGEASPAGDA